MGRLAKAILSVVGGLIVAFIQWGDRALKFIGIGGAPDDITTISRWLDSAWHWLGLPAMTQDVLLNGLIVASAATLLWVLFGERMLARWRRKPSAEASTPAETGRYISPFEGKRQEPPPLPADQRRMLDNIASLSHLLREPFKPNSDPTSFAPGYDERTAGLLMMEIEGAVDHVYYNEPAYTIYTELVGKLKLAVEANGRPATSRQVTALNAEIRALGMQLAEALGRAVTRS